MTQQRHIVPTKFTGQKFTGRHMAIILCSFFGVVIAVNVLMARLAISTFGGVVVENSYVASQQFNGWLDEARSEKALGWKATFVRGHAGEVVVRVMESSGAPLAGAQVRAIAEHPLGVRAAEKMTFREATPGSYFAPLQTGRWQVKLAVRARGHLWRAVGDVQ